MRGSLNAAALAACVSACSTASGPNMFTALSGGRWSIERDTDRITGRERLSVATISSKTEYSPPRDIGVATLRLVCARGPSSGPTGYPTVMIMFTYPVGSQQTSTVEYRFDDKPGRQPHPFIMPNALTTLITEPDQVRPFLSDLKGANTVFVRISSLSGSGSAEFAVANGKESVDDFLTECPMPAAEAPAARR
jgi:hypothetical protein